MTEFKVVAGNPTPEEVAVVLAVLNAAVRVNQQHNVGGHLSGTNSTWNRSAGLLRTPIMPGPGQWRASVRAGLN